MPKPADVMITVPVYDPQQYDIYKFLKVKPAALGILEILIGLLGLGLTIWRGVIFLLWSPIFFILFAVITVSAACSYQLCLVKSSQILGYVNIVVGFMSLYFHLVLIKPWGICFILVACDILTIIFSITVAATSCSCCCTSMSNSSALAQASVMYVLPGEPGSVLSAPLPNCSPFPSRPPPDYSPAPSTPPPSYEQALSAPPIPSAPPLTYEYLPTR